MVDTGRAGYIPKWCCKEEDVCVLEAFAVRTNDANQCINARRGTRDCQDERQAGTKWEIHRDRFPRSSFGIFSNALKPNPHDCVAADAGR